MNEEYVILFHVQAFALTVGGRTTSCVVAALAATQFLVWLRSTQRGENSKTGT
jgi:hypothetical protein